MRAGLRLGIAVAAAGLVPGQAPALAQSADQPSSQAPATEAIGPRELQNFNLQGTVTRPSEPAPASRPANRTTGEAPAAVAATPRPAAGGNRTATSGRAPAEPVRRAETRVSAEPSQQDDAPSSAQAAPALAAAVPVAAPGFSAEPEVAPATLAPSQGFPIWPWPLAAVLLGAGAIILFRRRTSREAYAGGPQADAFLTPEPIPQPRAPAPAAPPPPKSAPPKPLGVVSSRLRPWIDIRFEPMRCVVESQTVTFEFELELSNSGSAPARAVLTRASFFNAGPTQDEDIRLFFANPVDEGERVPVIPPFKSIALRPQISIPIDQLRVLDAGGRKVFVPLIGFNVLYDGAGASGQTSGAYLLGRGTKSEKMAPFRLDLGPRIFRGLKAAPLPLSVRS